MAQSNATVKTTQQTQTTWQNRLKSKAAWISIIALMFFVLKNYGLLEPIGLTEDSFNELSTLILAVFTAFGIFNNPTDPENY